jgi:mandelate racemase
MADDGGMSVSAARALSGRTKIREVRVRGVRVPIDPPHRTASGMLAESPLVLTDVFCGDGTIGHSIVFTYTAAALQPTAELIRNLGQLIAGEALAPAAVADRLAAQFRLLGMQGLIGMAASALDMALWDALARMHGVSLVRLLGGVEKPIPAYAAAGYEGAAGSAREAEAHVKRGFRGVKVKIGYASARQDLAVVRAVRSAVGPDTAVMIDYNQSLLPALAAERLRVLDDEGLTWIEEPVPAHDFDGHAHVAREIRTPIQCGENWWGPHDLQTAIGRRASDFMMPDVMKIGGVTGWLRAAALAEAHGIPLSSHLWPEVSAQLLCLTPTAHYLEYADWWNPILAEPLRLDDGMAIASTEPGSGVVWNETAIDRFTA